MCGIVGIVDARLGRVEIDAQLKRMNDVIVHRGPDDFGHVNSDGVGIGMRRLSIIDVAGGHQPLSNESGDIHIVCNGEIYNHHELRSKLKQKGYRFKTGSDAEVIVYLYEEYGDDFLQHINGMFGLAVLDSKRKRVLIARDRIGKKPVFYAHQNGKLLFGSEMKSLLAADPSLDQAGYSVLGQYLHSGFVGEPNTFYHSIKRLPSAHYAVYENGSFEIKPYWDFTFAADETLTEQDWIEQLDATLLNCVKARLESEVPLGVFLSGGLDSSAIVAYAHAAGLRPLKTFTIGFDRKEWDESDDALRIAKHFGTEHHALRLSENDILGSFEDTLSTLIHHFDEPFGDDSAMPTYHVSRLAKEHVSVILSGDGGDELFAGYSCYQGARFAEVYRRIAPSFVGRHLLPAIPKMASYALRGQLKYQALRAAKVFAESALPFRASYRDKTAIWRPGQIQQLLQPAAYENCDYLGEQYLPDHFWNLLDRNKHGDRDVTSRLSEWDIRSYMKDDILVKVDRMSMAHSLEVRSPMLDHSMVELSARMPTSMKIRGSKGKYALRKVLESKLPPKSMAKRKQGFGMPLREWFCGSLSDMVQDYLVSSDSGLPEEIFNREAVTKVVQQHRSGSADHSRKIWLLLCFAAWERNRGTSSSHTVAKTERPIVVS
jgi:asparagine synthase (glutamine-hydrolysing)